MNNNQYYRREKNWNVDISFTNKIKIDQRQYKISKMSIITKI